MKTVQCWHRNIYIHQWNRRESLEAHSCICSLLKLTRAPNIYNGNRIVSLMNGAGKTRYPHVKDWHHSSVLHHMPKISNQQIKHVKLRLETIRLLKENIRGQVGIDLGIDFLNTTPKKTQRKQNQEKLLKTNLHNKGNKPE